MNSAFGAAWAADWVWSLPLIVVCVIVHVVGLMLIFTGTVYIMNQAVGRRRFAPMFVVSMGLVILFVTILHGFEGMIWAAAYRFLNALPDNRSAMLYSLSAVTTYGHEDLHLKAQWQLMGALEALNGTLLFGLTTAFLFAMIREVWDTERARRRKSDQKNTEDRTTIEFSVIP